MKDKLKWAQVMGLVKKVEDKYGSIKDTPKFFHHYFVSGRKLKAYLDKNGWSLICKKTIWESIPIGAQYISKSKANILTKTTMRFEEV